MLERRLFGTEMEYGASWRLEADSSGRQSELSTYQCGRAISLYLPGDIQRLGSYATNGARIYTDHDHPEYATPEITLPMLESAEDPSEYDALVEALAIELGADEIVRDMIESWAAAEKLEVVASVNKRVMSGAKSWGYHSNFMVAREAVGYYRNEIPAEHRPAFQILGLHLATANIFLGSGGMYGNNATGRQFVIAQKAMYLSHDTHLDTVNYKPVINLRDETFAAKSQYARLHITSQDANISPWASKMKWGMSALIIGCMEEGIYPEWEFELREGQLCQLARHVAMDPSCKLPFELGDGRRITAIEIQEELYAAAVRLSQRHALSRELRWVLQEWRTALDDIQQDPDRLRDRVDWVSRQRFINGATDSIMKRQQENLANNRPAAVRTRQEWQLANDLSFDSLTTQAKCIPDWMRSHAWKEHMPPPELIKLRKQESPRNNRSRARALFVERYHDAEHPLAPTACWDHVILRTNRDSVVVNMRKDPFDPHPPKLELLRRQIEEPDTLTSEEREELRARDILDTETLST